MTGLQALVDKVGSEDWRQSPADLVAEGEADGTGACEWDPVALGSESTASNAVAEFDEPRVDFQGFGWGGL